MKNIDIFIIVCLVVKYITDAAALFCIVWRLIHK